VILHTMWGVTPHIRDLSDQFAAEGYEVLAPSLMERQDPGFADKDIDPARFAARQAAMAAVDFGGACWPDVQAAIDALAPPVMLMGFCFGGSAAWVAAAKCEGLSAAACFYGGHIVKFVELSPRCPTILHFGRQDELIPLSTDVQFYELRRHPDLRVGVVCRVSNLRRGSEPSMRAEPRRLAVRNGSAAQEGVRGRFPACG
jgi:carboxymethylenebutenolidase